MAEPVINLVLVGRTGNGKSATGNTLLGQKLFYSRTQAGGVTMECQMYRAAIQDGPIINVIDTPGLFDLSVSSDYINKEIVKCLTMAEEGIHAVLFVLSVKNRITQEEESTFYSLQRIFDSKIVDYIIVVFTGGDDLEEDGLTLDDYLRDGCPEFMRGVFRLCGGRKILFDNKTRDKDTKAAQLKQLMSHVADVEKRTGGKPYSPNWHLKIKKCMVYARDLGITWSDNSNYWSWLPIQYEASDALVEAAVLQNVCWLEINGKFNTRELTPNTKYEVVYVVKLNDTAYGWEIPVSLKLNLPNSRARSQERSVSLNEHIGRWWVDIPAGEFMTSSENSGEISFSMYETVSNSWKRGLIVKGVAIRPKN